MKKEQSGGLHKQHRQRMKKRYLEQGLDSFEPHNILELLLFYGIPQKDTNPLAHELLNHFGSLSEVFDAPYEELCSLKGMGENSAVLLKLIPDLCRAYSIDRAVKEHEPLDNVSKLVAYISPYFLGRTMEEIYLLFLDSALCPIRCSKIGEGDPDSSVFQLQELVRLTFGKNCKRLVLAHNHPKGLSLPSNSDCTVTHWLIHALRPLEIELVDHIIIAQDGGSSIRELHSDLWL